MNKLRRTTSTDTSSVNNTPSTKVFGIAIVAIVVVGLAIWQQESLLVLQQQQQQQQQYSANNNADYPSSSSISSLWKQQQQQQQDPIAAYAQNIDLTRIPPKGSPPNLPSPKASSEETSKFAHIRKRSGYGGTGEKAHLGGFTTVDENGISPFVWKDMMEYFGIKSLLDVGCGRGFSTSWFYLQGVEVQCVEGSHDALERNLLPALIQERNHHNSTTTTTKNGDVLVEHDFSLGPWWPEDTVDAVWGVELLEHVGRQFQHNYLSAFKKAAFLFVTHSTWGGWHHTEVHDDVWWQSRFELYGFVYSNELTQRIRQVAKQERDAKIPFPVHNLNKTYWANHVTRTMQVFVNPLVASKRKHAHLLSEPGCFDQYNKENNQHAHCGEEKNRNSRAVNTKIPESFKFIPYKEDVHQQWERYVQQAVAEDTARQQEQQEQR